MALTTLDSLLEEYGDRPVIDDGVTAINADSLRQSVGKLAQQLRQNNCHTIALYADNGSAWVIADIAAQLIDAVMVPIPLFFSTGQIEHVLISSGADTLLTSQASGDSGLDTLALRGNLDAGSETAVCAGLMLYKLKPEHGALMPPDTQKITFTSGTTGTPKGVCLSKAHQLKVARSLASAIGIEKPRHMCVLPLSTLLENLAGVYAPLCAGGTILTPSLASLGFSGSSQLDPRQLLFSISQAQPNTLILVPELLKVLVTASEQGWSVPASLKFVAVGGSTVSPSLMERAWEQGIPAYEGYGLSECGSVVTLNLPGAKRSGTTGKPLPHTDVIFEDGEVVVSGSNFLGYLNDTSSWGQNKIYTGDLGCADASGYVRIKGRRKNVLISSFGRNISPEWIESELLASPSLIQAVVVGDRQTHCTALIHPAASDTPNDVVDAWIRDVNSSLPDYARVKKWHRLEVPLTAQNGMVTDNGRLRRNQINTGFSHEIARLYSSSQEESTRELF